MLPPLGWLSTGWETWGGVICNDSRFSPVTCVYLLFLFLLSSVDKLLHTTVAYNGLSGVTDYQSTGC